MSGKGDKPRPMSVNRETFESNFDRIFGKPKEVKHDTSGNNRANTTDIRKPNLV